MIVFIFLFFLILVFDFFDFFKHPLNFFKDGPNRTWSGPSPSLGLASLGLALALAQASLAPGPSPVPAGPKSQAWACLKARLCQKSGLAIKFRNQKKVKSEIKIIILVISNHSPFWELTNLVYFEN